LNLTEQFGHAVYLFSLSDRHRHLTVADLDRSLVPALTLGQTMLLWDEGRVVAFSSWAWMSDEASERFLTGAAIRKEDWRSGENLWVIDAVAPFGHITKIARLYRDTFKPGKARWLRTKDGRKVEHYVKALAS
jgi:cytolysin-activating lysine-acyltransferase